MVYTSPKDGKDYILNLIDTPGHVDFSYQVSRSIRACEGAVLVVDATKGIQAQTLSNFYHAFEAELNVIPVINKIELPAAEVAEVEQQMVDQLDFNPDDILHISAKEGIGLDELFETIIERIEAPQIAKLNPTSAAAGIDLGDQDVLKCFLFGAKFMQSRGVACFVKVMQGQLNHEAVRQMMSYHKNKRYEIYEVGIVQPDLVPTGKLQTGQVGYFISNMKSVSDAKVGDTFYQEGKKIEPYPGYESPKSVVFAGIYPEAAADYDDLEKALKKISLTDGSVQLQYESSAALGSGFRCGFLGMLHMDVFRQRLKEEYDLAAIVTQPNVSYRCKLRNRDGLVVCDNPGQSPKPELITYWKEAIVTATIITPEAYLKGIKNLCEDRRGFCTKEDYMSNGRVVQMEYEMPLAELITDFFDTLKSLSQGYASLDYEHNRYEIADIKKVVFYLNGEPVDALSFLMHEKRVRSFAGGYAKRLKEILPSQLFQIAIQAKVGGKVVARETIKATRKDVTAKCYGGDITRKRKLLDRQKKGKKELRMLGNVPVGADVFLRLLKTN